MDEFAHLPAGLCYWRTQSFFAYPANPPLVKLLAALPVFAVRPRLDFIDEFKPSAANPPSTAIGKRFFETNQSRYAYFFMLGRLFIVGLSLLGGWFTFCWARDLFGNAPGLVAVALWCFGPNVLAHAQVVTADMGATALAVTATYWYWRWLKRPLWIGAVAMGVLLGVAELSKFTLLVLYPIWAVLWLTRRRGGTHAVGAGKVVVLAIVSVLAINAGYAFEGSCRPLGDFVFVSGALRRQHLRSTAIGRGADGTEVRRYQAVEENRFRGTWMGRLPVPLPEFYVVGVDRQEHDFETGPAHLSYLRGELRHGGWWYYYLYALGVKLPLGTLVLLVLTPTFAAVYPRLRASWTDELFLIFVPASVLALVSAHTGFNAHMRYVLPCLPFLFISASRVGLLLAPRDLDRALLPPNNHGPAPAGPPTAQLTAVRMCGRASVNRICLSMVVVLCIFWNIASALRIHPHYLSYYNELVGGPDNGAKHLIDSNIDWGQDLLFFKRWLNAHPEARPMSLAYFNSIDARVAGLELPLPPCGPTVATNLESDLAKQLGPQPGWYAISVTRLYGPPGDGLPLGAYDYFRRYQPVAKAGYSIYIYHITLNDTNRVRRQLGLSPLAK